MLPEPVSPRSPRRARPPLLTGSWRDVAFLHWAVDPARVAPLFPPGTRPDVLDGRTFVGLVAVSLRGTGLLGGAAVPWLGDVDQLNVRLYSVDALGRRGVVFRSLDGNRLLPAVAARGAGLPYAWSRVGLGRDGNRRSWTAGRRGAGPRTRLSMTVGPVRASEPTTSFLTDRWGLHHGLFRAARYVVVEHEPWVLHDAALEQLDTELPAAAGVPVPDAPPDSVLFSPGVDGVRIGPAGGRDDDRRRSAT